MVAWTKNRVVNFGAGFAERYIQLLVALNEQPYDQALFFKLLADAGLVKDVSQLGDEQDVAARRRKRWDSYLGKIREFGLGFAVEERRKGGQPRTVWRASDVARDFAEGRLSYRQFMALQCTRMQLPKPSMPLQQSARAELDRGVRVRPLQLILDALAELEVRSAGSYLSEDEVFQQLADVEQHVQLPSAVDAIVAARKKKAVRELAQGGYVVTDSEAEEAEDEVPGQASQDIWLNEFEASGYVRQLRPAESSGLPSHLLVRVLPRWEEWNLLRAAIPLQEYNTSEASINAYFDFLSESPSSAEREILMASPRVVQLEVPGEAQFDQTEMALSGRVEIIGGLAEGALVLLVGGQVDSVSRATIFEVTQSEPRPKGMTATVRLRPHLVRPDHAPVVAN